MARIRLGYRRDHEGQLRRDPSRDIDIGPAAASVDGLAALGRLSAFTPLAADTTHAMGAGPVTVRKATPEDLARFGARREAGAPLARPSDAMSILRPPARIVADPARVQASRLRGGQRAKEIRGSVPAAPAPAPIQHEEESVTTTSTPEAGVPCPCIDCIHAPVCRLREDVAGFYDNAATYESILLDEPAVRLRFEVVCDFHTTSNRIPVDVPVTVKIEAGPAWLDHLTGPEPVRAEHGGESWREGDPYPRDGEALNLLRLHGGNLEAVARTMGVTGTTIRNWIRRMESAGAVPDDVASLLAARSRKAAAA